jgi:hypothetical protein
MLKKLPKQLRDKKLWINGLLIPYADLPAKCPVDKNLYKISVQDKDKLLSYDEAVMNHVADARLGVGLVFRYSKSFPLVGIDLDVDPNNKKLLNLARGICQESGSYYERSLNGGYHILGLLEIPAKIGRRGKLVTPYGDLKYEIYSHGRYFLCTGRRGKASPKTIKSVQKLVDVLLEKLDLRSTSSQAAGASEHPAAGAPLPSPKMSDRKVLNAISGKQKLMFFALHQDGDLSEHNDDHSNGVMGWHSVIAFYTQDFEQVTRLFRKSALNYGKWKRENNRYGSKWARINACPPFQHEKIVKGLKRTFGSDPHSTRAGGADRADENKYVTLLKELGEVRRDLFTGDLYVRHERVWKNAFGNHIENHLRAMCQQRGSKDWKVTEIVPHLTHFMHAQHPQLLIDVPEWDGRDRIAEMSSKLTPADSRLTPAIIEEIFKMTLGQCWSKLYDPTAQPRMIVLQGGQGIGKDLWLEALLAGFGQYRSSLTIGKHLAEKDYAETLVRSAVVIVSEFDKVRDIGNSILKDMITKPFFDYRPSYGKTSVRSYCRCTWFGACNPDQVLTEAGANRRFIPIMLSGGPGEAIRWDYERSSEYSSQIIAQMRHLAEIVFKASQLAEDVLKSINEAYAPEDTTDIVLEAFDDMVRARTAEHPDQFTLFRLNDVTGDISRIARCFGITTGSLLQMLKASGRRWRHKKLGRFVGLPENASGMDKEQRAAREQLVKNLKQNSKRLQNVLDDLVEDDDSD